MTAGHGHNVIRQADSGFPGVPKTLVRNLRVRQAKGDLHRLAVGGARPRHEAANNDHLSGSVQYDVQHLAPTLSVFYYSAPSTNYGSTTTRTLGPSYNCYLPATRKRKKPSRFSCFVLGLHSYSRAGAESIQSAHWSNPVTERTQGGAPGRLPSDPPSQAGRALSLSRNTQRGVCVSSRGPQRAVIGRRLEAVQPRSPSLSQVPQRRGSQPTAVGETRSDVVAVSRRQAMGNGPTTLCEGPSGGGIPRRSKLSLDRTGRGQARAQIADSSRGSVLPAETPSKTQAHQRGGG